MKKIFILISILFVIVSCNESRVDTKVYHEVEITNDIYDVNGEFRLRTVVIDSCEYLIGSYCGSYAGFGFMAHKGNCKYCAERRKRELENLK